MNTFYKAKITNIGKITEKKDDELIKKQAFIVRLLNKKIGKGKDETNSLIFLKEAWLGDDLPAIGDEVLVSRFVDKGVNKKNKRKYRALEAKAKDINIGEYLIGRNGDLVEITRKYVNHFKGVLLNIKSLGIDKIKVTENHPFLVCKPKKTRVKRQEPKITRTREYYVPGKP